MFIWHMHAYPRIKMLLKFWHLTPLLLLGQQNKKKEVNLTLFWSKISPIRSANIDVAGG